MAAEAKQTCYEGSAVQSFQFFLQHSGEHEAVLQRLEHFLPGEFKRYKDTRAWSLSLYLLLVRLSRKVWGDFYAALCVSLLLS